MLRPLSPPAPSSTTFKKQAEESDPSTSGSHTHVIFRVYTLSNNVDPGAQTSLNCQPSDQSRTHSICLPGIWIVLYKRAFYAVRLLPLHIPFELLSIFI